MFSTQSNHPLHYPDPGDNSPSGLPPTPTPSNGSSGSWTLPVGTVPAAGGTDATSGTGEKDLYDFLQEAQLEQYFVDFRKRLKVASVSQLKYVEEDDLADIGMSKPEMRRLFKFFKRECPQSAVGKLKKLIENQHLIPAHLKDRLARSTSARSASTSRVPGDHHMLPSYPGVTSGHPDASSRAPGARHLILPTEVETGNVLGSGEFGKVHQGVWTPGGVGTPVQVAVKVLDKDKLSQEVSDFLKEVALMHSLDHPDVVRLYGVVMDQDCLKMVTELAPLRSLLECLRETAIRSSFSILVLHSFAKQIAHGMEYLEGKRLIHRDLAARNILVFSKDKVKISDFGMSRALQLGKEYYQTNFNVNLKLPIAWCSPESINYLKFTSASDVWAYGVTLWEMFTYGFQPWAGLTGQQILERIDQPTSDRLEQPEACPHHIYQLMLDCWNHEPKDRPNFIQITNRLPRMVPEQVQATGDYLIEEESRATTPVNGEDSKPLPKPQPLFFKTGEIFFILDKKSDDQWKGCLMNGRSGVFPPLLVRPYVPSANQTNSLMRSPQASTSKKLSLSRRASLTDLGYRSKQFGKRLSRQFSTRPKSILDDGDCDSLSSESSRKQAPTRGRLRADMIGLPENDFRHIGHVGFDGTVFGDVTCIKNGDQDKLLHKISPSGSCLTVTTVSETSNRLSSGTLTDVSSHMDVGEESPPYYETLDSQNTSSLASSTISLHHNPYPPSTRTSLMSASSTSTLGAQPPPLPPSRITSQLSEDYDLFSDFKLKSDNDSCSLDFGSALMDDIFKCFSMDDTATTSSSSTTTTTTPTPESSKPKATNGVNAFDTIDFISSQQHNQPSHSMLEAISTSSIDSIRQQRRHEDRDSTPVNSDGPRHPSPIKTQRQEAVVKPMMMEVNPKTATMSSSSTESSDCSSVSSLGGEGRRKLSSSLFSRKNGEEKEEKSTKTKPTPIYAVPKKFVQGVTGGNATAKKQAAANAAAESRKAIISGPILVTGPNVVPAGAQPIPQPASLTPPLAVEVCPSSSSTSSSSKSSISPAPSQTSVASTGVSASGVGALRALQRGDGVLRVGGSTTNPYSNRRRPSLGEGNNTLTRTRQPSLPLVNPGPLLSHHSNGQASSNSVTPTGPEPTPHHRISTVDSVSSEEDTSSGASPSSNSSPPNSNGGTTERVSNKSSEHTAVSPSSPIKKFHRESESEKPNVQESPRHATTNGTSSDFSLSSFMTDDAASFWGSEFAGLLSTDSVAKATPAISAPVTSTFSSAPAPPLNTFSSAPAPPLNSFSRGDHQRKPVLPSSTVLPLRNRAVVEPTARHTLSVIREPVALTARKAMIAEAEDDDIVMM